MKKNSLAILGCQPDGLEILMEIAQLEKGYEEFHIFRNVTDSTDLKPFFLPTRKVFVNEIESNSTYAKLLQRLPICFGVVGIESKSLVYNYFHEKYNIDISNFVQLVHPSSVIASSASMENGVIVEALCTISSFATLGFGVTVKRNCSIGHHSIIDNFVTLNPGVQISGKVNVGEATMLGTGTVVKDGVSIGENTIIGVGSVVVKDIPPNVIAFGNPCKIIRNR